jgi:hypothetical protein
LAIRLVVHLARLDARRVVAEGAKVQDYDPIVIGSLSKPGRLHRRFRKERPQTRPAKLAIAIPVGATLSSCGREGTTTGPSGPTSFLTGTWRGTVTIQVNPGDPSPPAAHDGDDWNDGPLSSNSPPTQISTRGGFNSPRGCRGIFASVGTAEATRIEADFTGTDCQLATFTGRVQGIANPRRTRTFSRLRELSERLVEPSRLPLRAEHQ